jgi:hypothetical protein
MRLASRENISTSFASLTSLARRENRDKLRSLRERNLQDLQTSKIIIHSEKLVLDPKFSQDSRKTPELKLVMILASLATKNFCLEDSQVLLQNLSVILARSESCYKISFCETGKKRFFPRNFVARLASRESRYEISVCETLGKQNLILILTREFHGNLARILGLKSESRFSREFQKVILVSTLISIHT